MVNTAVHRLALDLPPLQEMGVIWSELVSQLGGLASAKPADPSDRARDRHASRA